jgi:hypothetical protein
MTMIGRRIGNLIDAATLRVLLTVIASSVAGGAVGLLLQRLLGGSLPGLLASAMATLLTILALYAATGQLKLVSERLRGFIAARG